MLKFWKFLISLFVKKILQQKKKKKKKGGVKP